MKFCFCAIFLILTLSVYADAFGMWKGGCKSEADCPENQCCLKQQFGAAFGQCVRRPQEGEMCVPQNKFNKMYQQHSCPCPEGLECSSGSEKKSPGMNYALPPVCRPIPETTEEPTTES